MNLQTALIPIFLFILSILSAGCQPASQRDSVRKSDLVGGKWKLSKFLLNGEDLPINIGPDITLEFRDDLIGGVSGCNNYQAGWKLGKDGHFELSGPIAQTANGCLNTIMALERSYTAVLKEVHTLVLAEGLLVIDSTAGQLTFVENR